eukprot:3569318-Pleurochrysis_carterae.AAC.3
MGLIDGFPVCDSTHKWLEIKRKEFVEPEVNAPHLTNLSTQLPDCSTQITHVPWSELWFLRSDVRNSINSLRLRLRIQRFGAVTGLAIEQ